MTTDGARIGAWDAAPNPRYNHWTIGNASEVVPGISSPFFSTMAQQYEYISATQVTKMVGIEDLVPCYEPPIGNWAAVYAGRWALNIEWFNAVIGSWQTGGPSGAMAQFISATDGQDISAKANDDPERAKRTWLRVRRLRGALPGVVDNDRERVEKLRADDRSRDYTAMTERQLWQHLHYRGLSCGKLLSHHLMVSLSAADYTDRLNKLLDRALPGHDPALLVALTSALREVESARPAKGAWDVAQYIHAHKKLAAEVRELAPHAIVAKLARPKKARWRGFAEKFGEFIALYGFRGQGELDPGFADWEEEPAYAISAIKAHVGAPPEKNPNVMEEQAARGREATEAQIGPTVPRGARVEYRELLQEAQKFTRMRESSKANWVRCDRLLRRPLLELGNRFVTRGLIAARDDIFWLVESEIATATHKKVDPATLRALPEQRRKEAERLAGLELPDVFQLPVQATPRVALTPGATTLQGMPVSAGKASGPARVVMSAASAMEIDLEAGEVLVAPFTDAPWTPLFVPAAAVVVETGGVLSHAATVAREFGIPAVVAVKGATQLIRTGQTVTVDGTTGTVTLGDG